MLPAVQGGWGTLSIGRWHSCCSRAFCGGKWEQLQSVLPNVLLIRQGHGERATAELWSYLGERQAGDGMGVGFHRIPEGFGLEGILKIIWFHPSCLRQGYLTLSQIQRIAEPKNHRTLLCRPVRPALPRAHPTWSLGFLFVTEFFHEVLVHPHRPSDVFAWLPLCWDVLLQGSIPWHSTKEILEEARVCYPEIQVLLCALLELAPSGLPLSLKQTRGCLESPVKTRSCECGAASPCLECLSHSVFLAGQPAADPNFNITCPCPPFHPDPWAPHPSPGEALGTPAGHWHWGCCLLLISLPVLLHHTLP